MSGPAQPLLLFWAQGFSEGVPKSELHAVRMFSGGFAMTSVRPSLPRLAFGNAIAQASSDLDAFVDAQRAVMPSIRRYDPIENGQPFLHRSAVVQLGDLRLVASASTPVSVSVDRSIEMTLLLPLHGWSTSVIEGREYRWQAGTSAMFLPGTGRTGSCGVRSLLGITFRPEHVLAVAQAMRRPRGHGGRTLDLRTPRLIPLAGSRSAAMPMLRRILSTINFAGCDESALRPLGVEETLYGLIASILAPDTLTSGLAPQRASRSAAGVRRATDYIAAHLPRAITLDDLERVSGLSARSLQLAFRREHDCSPREWIQGRRLLMSRERLTKASPEETVTRVALACGFTRHSTFAAAYARRFGELPSTTLARARRA